MRIRVERIEEGDPWGETFVTYRLCEPDGSVCICWAPGIENPDPLGALDRGGFDQRSDARAFALGLDRWRAEVGLIPESVEDIDREREELDNASHINAANRRKTLDDATSAALEPMDDEPQLDFGALLEAVEAPAAPVVTHRRRVA